MSSKVTCPGCGANYTLAPATKARSVACKKCGAAISLHVSETDSSVAARSDAGAVPRSTRALDRRRFDAPPVYTRPVFYVGIAATVVCTFLAIKFH